MHFKMRKVFLALALVATLVTGSPFPQDQQVADGAASLDQAADGAVDEVPQAADGSVPVDQQADGGGAMVPEQADGSAPVGQADGSAENLPQQADGAGGLADVPQADGAGARGSNISPELPIFKVHDAATESMQQRMTIPDGETCDTAFGTELEDKLDEMEKNKMADESAASKLDEEFKAIMSGKPDAQLCVSGFLCDNGVCKPETEGEKRGGPQGRAFGSGRAGRAGEEAAATPAPTTTIAPAGPEGDGDKKPGPDGDKKPASDATPTVQQTTPAPPAPAPAEMSTVAPAAPTTTPTEAPAPDNGSMSLHSSLTLMVLGILGIFCLITV